MTSHRGVLVTVLLALGIAGAAAGGAQSGGATSTGNQARASDHSTDRVMQRLRARGLQVRQLDSDARDGCTAHSYGQVEDFFRQNPCTALHRALFEVQDDSGRALVAVAWVDMPDESGARRYQQLVDRHTTGNVRELSTAVRWTGERYVSTRDGVTVVNAQAEPVGATPAAVGLAQRAAGTAVG